MRGGSLMPFFWALIVTASAITNVIWTHLNLIQAGMFATAISIILLLAVVLTRLAPEARRRGAPELRTTPQAVPSTSYAATLAGLSFGCFVFGFAFGAFPIFLGGGLLITALARLLVELRAQRRFQRALLDERSTRETAVAEGER